MNYQEKKPAKIIYLLAFASILSITTTATAQRHTFQTRLNLKGEYSDNIQLESVNPKDDIYTTIGPSLSYIYSTEKLDLSSNAAVDVIRYSKESAENRENQDYSLNGNFFLTERVRLTGNLQYTDDMTQEGELLETGEVSSWQNRKQQIGSGGIYWRCSELSEIALNYDYLNKEFEKSSSIDYDRHSISLAYNRYINSGLDTISLVPNYEYRDSVDSQLDNYNLSLAWKHTFTETFLMNVSVGGRYTEEEFSNGFVTDNSGWIASISVNRRTETTTTELGYNRNIYTNVGGGETEADQFSLIFNKSVFSRLAVGFEGYLFLRRPPGGSSNNSDTYYQVSPTLSYSLTERHALVLGYRYASVNNKALDTDITADQNAFWLALRMSYDKIY